MASITSPGAPGDGGGPATGLAWGREGAVIAGRGSAAPRPHAERASTASTASASPTIPTRDPTTRDSPRPGRPRRGGGTCPDGAVQGTVWPVFLARVLVGAFV